MVSKQSYWSNRNNTRRRLPVAGRTTWSSLKPQLLLEFVAESRRRVVVVFEKKHPQRPVQRWDRIGRSLPVASFNTLPEFAIMHRLNLAGFDFRFTPLGFSQFLAFRPRFSLWRQRTEK